MKPLRYLFILCGLTLCANQLHAEEQLHSTIDSLKYYYWDTQDGYAYVEGYVDGLTNAVIPEYIQVKGYGKKTVAGISYYSFRNCTTLKTVIIPNSVRSIGMYCFSGCSNLSYIKFPDYISYIDYDTFYNCTSLTSVDLPSGITGIDDLAFYGCTNLTSVTIPDGVLKIGQSAFYGCPNLVSINIPSTVTSIGSYAFCGCRSLASIHLPQYINKIEDGTFYGCSSLTSIVLPKDLTQIGNQAFRGCSNLNSMSIPESVTSIGNNAFRGCVNLSSVNIPNGITQILDYTFSNCSTLVSVVIPESVTSIGYCGFGSCTSLESVTFPDSVTYIGGYAFDNCWSLTSISFPEGITSISDLINNCTSLTHITIPGSVKTIGGLSGLTNLSTVIIRNGTERIGDYAFSGFTNLTSITIPESVTEIGNEAFYKCTGLSSIDIPESVITIGNRAFNGCTGLISLNIPNSVTSIGNSVFDGCTGLISVNIPNSVKNIGSSAFNSCSSLTTVNLPDSLSEISSELFRYCSSLTSITIPPCVQVIGSYSFEECTDLTSVIFSDGLERIDRQAFYKCTNLASITLPGSIRELGEGCFSRCGLTSITVQDGLFLEYVRTNVFNNTTTVKSLTIPSSLSGDILGLFIGTVETYNGQVKKGTINIVGNTVLERPANNSGLLYLVDSGMYEHYTRSSAWNKNLKQVISAEMLNLTTVECTADSLQSDLFTQLGDNAINVANLKIKGSINGFDIMTLRNKTVHLLYLDLSEADVVANDGGYEYYPGSCMTEDNRLGDCSLFGTNLRSVVLPNTLKAIGRYAFYDCGFLETVVFNQGLETIDENAFNNCKSLETAVFKEGLETIGIRAFLECRNLVIKDLPKSLVTIGNEAFRYCKVASYLNIPDNVETIGEGAFRDCSGVDSIVVGKSVTDLKNFAFGGCPASYVSLDKARGLTRIGEYAFGSCKNLKTITFGRNDKLTVVAYRAFEYCSSLEEILLPFSVESIGAGAFRDCSSLKYIKIPSMTRTIGEGAFSGCDYIENIYTYTVEPTEINQNTFTCFLQATLNVPKTSALLYKYDTQWSQFVRVHEFEEPYDAFYLKGDLELTEDGGRLEGEPDADMYETSGFIVQGDDIQELNDVVLVHNGTDGATIIGASGDVTGSQVNLTAKSMKVNISVDGNRWYFFCFPFEVEQDSIECTTEHVFYEYDSQARANGNTGWVKVPDDFGFLSKDVGYIFQTNRSGILTIHVGSDYLTFTANNEKENLQTASSNNPADAHWNFIGNPYISYYDVQDLAQEYDAPIAIWNGRSYDVYKPGDDDYQLKPFEAFFVQKETGASYVEFLPENRMTYNRAAEVSSLRAARRAQIGNPMDLDRQLVNIMLMGQDSVTDRTRIVYSVNASMDYEIGVDAAKFQADGVPQLYTLNGKTKYAINERPMGTDDIKLGYIAPKAGTYTLSVPRHDAEVEIYDNETRQTVDFTFGDYQFTTKAGTYNDRFVIHKTSGGVTAVENGFRLDGMTVTAFDGGIEIEGQFKGKIQIYSESGMLMAEPKQAGRVQLDGGVYIIKIGDRSIKLNI